MVLDDRRKSQDNSSSPTGGATAAANIPGQGQTGSAHPATTQHGQTQQLVYAGDAGGGGGHLALGPPQDSGIDIAKIEGQVKVSSIKKVADFVDKHPEESVSILRSWLHEG